MASMTLYPPIMDSSMPIFNKNGNCRIYFSLSKFNIITDIYGIQISIIYQKSGINAVNKTNSINDQNFKLSRLRETGIILINHQVKGQENSPIQPVSDKDNLYYIDITPNDINGGWTDGEIYKVQIRFSGIHFTSSTMQEAWLNANEDQFSEWSTVTAIKPIDQIKIQIPILGYDNGKDNDINTTKKIILYSSTLDFHGTYSTKTKNENLYSYQVKLYNENGDLIEDSKTLYVNKYFKSNQFKYLFQTELKNGKSYNISFTYTTDNGFTETIKDLLFSVSLYSAELMSFKIYSIDNAPSYIEMKKYTSVIKEEEEGRIGLKIFDINNKVFNGNICIKRTDSKSNFTKWEDIKIINCVQESINSKDIYYDYTIESGIWYKYAIQEISIDGYKNIVKGEMSAVWETPVIRNFEYSYLLGENGVQLKLKYNNDMNSFKINISENRTETIGGQFPFITRNGNMYYKSFPVNALISFNADEDETFIKTNDVYNIYNNATSTSKRKITEYYQGYNKKHSVNPNYDYIHEFFFREKVLEFLHDGKPKLFKSATEGNIIVRLMDINNSPEQSLNRLLYSFSATAYEIAEANLENYAKYKFFNLGIILTEFVKKDVKLGQLVGDFKTGKNIIEAILEKYDSRDKNIAGYSINVETIKNLEIEINTKPLKVQNNDGQFVLGNNILCDNSLITIYANKRRYVFDPLITFNPSSSITFVGLNEQEKQQNSEIDNAQIINATINFTYEFTKKPYEPKKIKSKSVAVGIGQYYEPTNAGISIYRKIYNKYYQNWDKDFCALSYLYAIEIEANPKSVFLINDVNDMVEHKYMHEVGVTGVLNLNDLSSITDIKFLGIRQPDGNIETNNIISDIMVNYTYILTKGEYE